MLSPQEIRRFYERTPLQIPELWSLSSKHFRIETPDRRFIKLNELENRLNQRELSIYCCQPTPLYIYFSVLNWLLPERVGKKYKASYCASLNGEYFIDIDGNLGMVKHEHKLEPISDECFECLGMSKRLTLQVCEAIQLYYHKTAIVFSRRSGFHVHVLDFSYEDCSPHEEWTRALG
jgi:DNA primase catalytic subunit